jgi:hypothetical protein
VEKQNADVVNTWKIWGNEVCLMHGSQWYATQHLALNSISTLATISPSHSAILRSVAMCWSQQHWWQQ